MCARLYSKKNAFAYVKVLFKTSTKYWHNDCEFVFRFHPVREELLQNLNRFTPAGGLLATNISWNLSPATDTPVCLFRNAKAREPSKTRHVHYIPGVFTPFCLQCRDLAGKSDLRGNSCLVHLRMGMGNQFQDDAPLPTLAALDLHHMTCWATVVPLWQPQSVALYIIQLGHYSSIHWKIILMCNIHSSCSLWGSLFRLSLELNCCWPKSWAKRVVPHPDISQDMLLNNQGNRAPGIPKLLFSFLITKNRGNEQTSQTGEFLCNIHQDFYFQTHHFVKERVCLWWFYLNNCKWIRLYFS